MHPFIVRVYLRKEPAKNVFFFVFRRRSASSFALRRRTRPIDRCPDPHRRSRLAMPTRTHTKTRARSVRMFCTFSDGAFIAGLIRSSYAFLSRLMPDKGVEPRGVEKKEYKRSLKIILSSSSFLENVGPNSRSEKRASSALWVLELGIDRPSG